MSTCIRCCCGSSQSGRLARALMLPGAWLLLLLLLLLLLMVSV
jgi:hypothetical protein